MKTEQKTENQEVMDDASIQNEQELGKEVNGESDNMTDESASQCDNTASLAEEVAQWKDKYMRLSAEFDNFRKRTLKEKMELMEYGSQGVIKSFLTVADDYQRAVSAMEKSSDVESIKQGVVLIQNKFNDVLKQNNVSEIDAMGKELDTDFHDAIAKVPSDECNKGKVIDVVEQGYMLKDKVIRYAKVVVGE